MTRAGSGRCHRVILGSEEIEFFVVPDDGNQWLQVPGEQGVFGCPIMSRRASA